MGNEPLRPQLLVDLAEGRLPFVEIYELQFHLNDHGILQFFPAVHEHGKLSALDIDFEEIDIVDFVEIVQAPRLNPASDPRRGHCS